MLGMQANAASNYKPVGTRLCKGQNHNWSPRRFYYHAQREPSCLCCLCCGGIALELMCSAAHTRCRPKMSWDSVLTAPIVFLAFMTLVFRIVLERIFFSAWQLFVQVTLICWLIGIYIVEYLMIMWLKPFYCSGPCMHAKVNSLLTQKNTLYLVPHHERNTHSRGPERLRSRWEI